MSNVFAGRPSRVWAHGKWIEVGYLDDPPQVRRGGRSGSRSRSIL